MESYYTATLSMCSSSLFFIHPFKPDYIHFNLHFFKQLACQDMTTHHICMQTRRVVTPPHLSFQHLMATTLSLIDSLSRTQQQTNKRTHECNVSMPYVISMQNTSLIHKYQPNLHFTLHSSLKLNSSLYLRLQKKCSDLVISYITG